MANLSGVETILGRALESARNQYNTANPSTPVADAQIIAKLAATFLLSLNGTA